LGDLGSTILIGVALVLLLVLSVFLQALRTRRSPIGKVVGIASNLRHNEKLCNNFSYDRSIGRFKTSAWDKNRKSVDFLPEELLADLSKLFESIAEANGSIDAARKHGSDSYMSAVDVDKFKAPLASCKEQVQEWVYENMNNPDYLPKKRSILRL